MSNPKIISIKLGSEYNQNEISTGFLIEIGYIPIGNNTYQRGKEKVKYDGVNWWKGRKKIKTVKDL